MPLRSPEHVSPIPLAAETDLFARTIETVKWTG